MARLHADLFEERVCQDGDHGELVRGRTAVEVIGEHVQVEEVVCFVHRDGVRRFGCLVGREHGQHKARFGGGTYDTGRLVEELWIPCDGVLDALYPVIDCSVQGDLAFPDLLGGIGELRKGLVG